MECLPYRFFLYGLGWKKRYTYIRVYFNYLFIMTNFVNLASTLEDIVMDPASAPILTIVAASAICVWSVRMALVFFINNGQTIIPSTLTNIIIVELDQSNLFTPQFISGLTPGDINPFTPEVIAQLRLELTAGDEILYDLGIHSILGPLPPTLEVIIRELSLISPMAL